MSDKNLAERDAAAALERQGDEADAAGRPAEKFYRDAQKILLPVGVMCPDPVEHDLRMAAFQRLQQKIRALHSLPPRPPPSEAGTTFQKSMAIGYEQWHDGVGYDLDALAKIAGAERESVVADLSRRIRSASCDWRDVDALAALGGPQAKRTLEEALPEANPRMRLHIGRELVRSGVDVPMDRIIADALRSDDHDGSHSFALDLAAQHATPYLRDVLLERTRNGDRVMRVHAAALLFYLGGMAKERFDMAQRPFFLRFGEEDPAERAGAYAELCRRLGIGNDAGNN